MDEYRWQVVPPPNYYDILDAVEEYGNEISVGVFKKKSAKVYEQKIDADYLYMLEALASKAATTLSQTFYSIDLTFLLWARQYEYFSRSHLVSSLRVFSKKRHYEFMKRQQNNNLVKKVSLQMIGKRNESVFYLSSLGIDVADKAYNILVKGDTLGL